ncbi:uncharacterized protein PV06_00987 [Exophiala oligosperma]|uniref:Uncharacterized protein n=2 Tax=Chaetothyriales TaxID=34395 RepID=A0A0D2EKH4_9EURO|nr:uncharacterized protein PV06_00987 [Exophiala oligosperma]KAJ9633294.1 hypothetical protein H2204_007190 [Knufia peltigerae]KIW48399.1 hypothetical protein PV06_00987 [Exophiala oligosperma]
MTIEEKKKIFVASTYEFTQLGSDEVIRNLMQSSLDPKSAPFVTFGADTQTFSTEVDPGDDRTLLTILHQVSNYVTAYESRGLAFDEEERVKPLEGTVTDDYIRDTRSQDGPLGDWLPDVDSDGQDALESLQHLTAFWTPRNGDIKILPHLYAQQITNLTGTSIYFEEAEQRCRLFHGQFSIALEKLQRLEPLLEIIKHQQAKQPLRAAADLLIWNPTQREARIEYVHIQPGHPSYHRIIVNKGERDLTRMVIGELRTHNLEHGVMEKPEKFSLGQARNDTKLQASSLWNDFVFESFGNPRNLEPVIPSKAGSKLGSDQKKLKRDSKDARIEMWSNKIVCGADPEVAPEAPIESSQPTGRRRLLVADSDDEEDETSRVKPTTIAQASKKDSPPKTESPTEPTQPVGRRRLLLVDSDDEEDEMLSAKPSSIAQTVKKDSLPRTESPTKPIQPTGRRRVLVADSDDEEDESSPAKPSTIAHAEKNADKHLLEDTESFIRKSSPRSVSNKSPYLSATSTPVHSQDCQTQSVLRPRSSRDPEILEVEAIEQAAIVDEPHPVASWTLPSSNALPRPCGSKSSVSSPSIHVVPEDGADTTLQRSRTPDHSRPTPFRPPLTPEMPDISTTPRPKFDSNAYRRPTTLSHGQRGFNIDATVRGGIRGNSSRGRGRSRSSRSGMWSDNDSHNPEARTLPLEASHRRGRGNYAGIVGAQIHTASRAGQDRPRGRGRGRGQGHLVELASGPSARGYHRVPPGFESFVPLERPASYWDQVGIRNIMDDPLEPTATHMPTEKLIDLSETQSFSSRVSTRTGIRFSEEGSEYRVASIPLPDQTRLKQNSIALALAAIEASQKQKEHSNRQEVANKKEADDRVPPTHSTMRQQGKNPGKTSTQQETKAERQARLAKAMREAYGSQPISQLPKPSPTEQSDEMSKWKRRRIAGEKNSVVAQAHPEILNAKAKEEQCSKLIKLLQSSFEAARAFNGRLNFDIGFGQVIASSGPHIQDQKLYDISGWNSLFDPPNGVHLSSATFTKILTTNGEDVDGVLRFRNPNKGDSNRLWSQDPGPTTVTYEFSCQNRFNEDFLIVVDQGGNYELRKGQITVGTVNMHVPESIWDCAATLSGHLIWPDPPETLTNSVDSFVQSLYVLPSKQKLIIVFRQPTDHEIKIKNLIVRRVSYHDCNLRDCQDVQLKVVESKSLLFKCHPEDRNLWQGYEAAQDEYETIAKEGRIHYELSIVHKQVTAALKGNEDLEIGEFTPSESTGKSILEKSVIRAMLDVATHMVSKMDFVGTRNVGTLMQLDIQDAKQKQDIVATIPPTRLSNVGLGHRSAQSTKTALAPMTLRGNAHSGRGSGWGSAMPAAHLGPGGRSWEEPVHGIRINEVAQVFLRPDGSKYRLGMGGAEVPVVEDGEEDIGTSTVFPDDSASHVGPLRPMGGGPSSGSSLVVSREKGFW